MDYLNNVLNIHHRDLKASNIFLERIKDKLFAKISDFGDAINPIYSFRKNTLDGGSLRWAVKIIYFFKHLFSGIYVFLIEVL